MVAGYSAGDTWKTLTSNYNQVANSIVGQVADLKPVNVDLEKYLTQRALDGLFLKLANEEQKILESIQQKYDTQTSPYYAAARLWTDGVINPLNTRKWISMGIEAANHSPIEKAFNLGIIQV